MRYYFLVDPFASTGFAIGTRRRLDELMAAAILMYDFDAHCQPQVTNAQSTQSSPRNP